MRLYCSSILHKKGYCIRQYKGISLQTITQIVIYTLNQKVKNIVSCDNIAEFLEKNYKNLGFLEYEQEHNELKRRLEKTNKIIASLYNDYKNNILQEYDFKKMYNQEIEKREKINEQIEKINQKIQNKQNISNKEFKRVSKKVADVKQWKREQLADVIESVKIDSNDNIFLNYRYDLLGMA